VSSEPPKYAIEIEAIKTPKGLVPTVESLKRIVKGLNLIDADLGRMNLKMEANIRALLREVKTLQKLVADDTIASESSVERLGVLSSQFEALEKSMDKLVKQKPSKTSDASLAELQKELVPTLTQVVQRIEEMITLFETRFEEFLRELQSNILVTVKQAVESTPKKEKVAPKRKTKTSST
jgi:alanyl-tRNA synthetase